MGLLVAEVAGTGMAGITNQLTTGVTAANLFGTVGEVMPFVIQIIGFAFGYRVLRLIHLYNFYNN